MQWLYGELYDPVTR